MHALMRLKASAHRDLMIPLLLRRHRLSTHTALGRTHASNAARAGGLRSVIRDCDGTPHCRPTLMRVRRAIIALDIVVIQGGLPASKEGLGACFAREARAVQAQIVGRVWRTLGHVARLATFDTPLAAASESGDEHAHRLTRPSHRHPDAAASPSNAAASPPAAVGAMSLPLIGALLRALQPLLCEAACERG